MKKKENTKKNVKKREEKYKFIDGNKLKRMELIISILTTTDYS